MAVKYFDKEKNEWVIFPGTVGAPGKDAYQIAVDNGYSGTQDEYNAALTAIPDVVSKVESADSTPTKDSSDLITSGAVYSAIDSIEIPSLDNYATKTEVSTAEQNAKDYSDSLAGNYDAAGAATTALTDAKSYTDTKIGAISIPSLDGYATEEWVEGKGYLTSHQDISNLATKAEVEAVSSTLDNYYNKDEVDAKIADAGSIDLTGYYTKTETDSKISEAMDGVLKYEGDGDISVEDFALKDDTATKTELQALANQVAALTAGLSEASTLGAPGWKRVTENSTVTLSGYTDEDNFGVIIVPMENTVTFTNGYMINNTDDSDGLYKVYCIMYVDGMYFINMGIYSSVN